MANNLYTTKTASLRATKADINKLDTKRMLLNGKNILDYISDSEFNSYDTRDPQLKNDELDIWNTEISLSDNGHIEVKPKEHTKDTISLNQSITLKSAIKIIDNKVLGTNDNHLMYWHSDGLTNGTLMFFSSTQLTTFSSDLSGLTDGESMFTNCYNLTSFSSDLSSLTNGYFMFNSCSKLTSFNSDLSSLTDGRSMFMRLNAPSIPTPPGVTPPPTPSVTYFTTFSSNLSSLMYGQDMFSGCNLDAQSVANIIHTLPTHESNGEITIGIGCDNTEADQLIFAQECDCETWQELLDDFSAKNWTVTFQCNGRPTTTYNMRRGETLPIYTKLEEITDEKHYQYTSTDGSKFYNINYFHSTNGSTEGYDVFSSLEEAISTYNVTPKN